MAVTDKAKVEVAAPPGPRQRIATFVLWSGVFLIGLYIGRAGILSDPAAHRTLLRRVCVVGLALGLAAGAIYATFLAQQASLPGLPRVGFIIAASLGPLILSLGYVAGVALLTLKTSRLTILAKPGRMSLSNYLSQNIVMATIFYGYGLGWYGKVGPAAGLALAVVIYVAEVALSVMWLRHFRFGPVEWVWRLLTYLSPQPLRLWAGEPKAAAGD
jgi:uncharacterized protein